MVLLEFIRGQVVQALMWTHGVVMPAPRLNENAGFAATAEPLEAQTFVSEFAIEGFVRAVLPRLARIDHRGVDAIFGEPLQNRLAHKLGTTVGAQIGWGAVEADQAREYVNHAPRADRPSNVDSQALMGEFVDDRQAFNLLPVGTGIEDEIVGPDMIGGAWRQRAGSRGGDASARSFPRQLQPSLAPQAFGARALMAKPSRRRKIRLRP